MVLSGYCRCPVKTGSSSGAIAVALTAVGGSPVAVAILLAGWGLIGTAASVGWWTWLSKVLPRDIEAGGGLMAAVIQLAIALGTTIGGFLYDMSGYRSTFLVSSANLSGSAFLASLGWRTAARARAHRGQRSSLWW